MGTATNDYVIQNTSDVEWGFISTHEQSDWECRLTGDTLYTPRKGEEPNWFHRLMQRLAFGFVWRKRNQGGEQ